MEGATDRGVTLDDAADFESITGKGVQGRVEGRSVALGNLALMEDLQVALGDLAERAETMRGYGQTVMFVSVDGRPAGLVGVADPIKETTPDAIEKLHAEGVHVVMITGDSKTTAQVVGDKLGIDEVVAEVLLRRRLKSSNGFRQREKSLAMAGDGINDAPGLARPRSASRWARARTWRWRAPGSRSSR